MSRIEFLFCKERTDKLYFEFPEMQSAEMAPPFSQFVASAAPTLMIDQPKAGVIPSRAWKTFPGVELRHNNLTTTSSLLAKL